MKNQIASVLVVDDEPAIRQILARSVSAAGFGVTQAVDGADALEKMAGGVFDVVITDVRMPNMDGLQLLGEIRSRFPETGVILITGHRGDFPEEGVRTAKADGLISKPFHNHDIVRKLKQFCQERNHRRVIEKREAARQKQSAEGAAPEAADDAAPSGS